MIAVSALILTLFGFIVISIIFAMMYLVADSICGVDNMRGATVLTIIFMIVWFSIIVITNIK